MQRVVCGCAADCVVDGLLFHLPSVFAPSYLRASGPVVSSRQTSMRTPLVCALPLVPRRSICALRAPPPPPIVSAGLHTHPP